LDVNAGVHEFILKVLKPPDQINIFSGGVGAIFGQPDFGSVFEFQSDCFDVRIKTA
jgi:hypothetical protein